MTALLGTITRIGEINEARRVEIHFKALCRLPARTPAPEWLADQVLKVEREVVDVRELGHAGDSIVLSVEESARWLAPLQVSPDICYGRLPETLTLALRWWKEEKGPEFTIRANGQRLSGTFVKDGTGFTAVVPLAGVFPAETVLPVAIEVSVDKLSASCTVLPAHTPYVRKLRLPLGEMVRIENDWYLLDVLISKEAGGIAAWREQGRGLEHFRRPEGIIQRALDTAGHLDYYTLVWRPADNLQAVALACAGIRREEGLTRVFLEGTVDEGKNIHTTVTCQVLDALPLAIWQREFLLKSGKKPEGDKAKEETPKVPIDEVTPMAVGFRSAWLAERHGSTGSRLLCAYDENLVTLRSAIVNDAIFAEGWRMSAGWAMAEHPERRAYMLYLFDRQRPPLLRSWSGIYSVTLEPYWLMQPLRAGDSCGFTLAISAGECGGASADGAWVACRTTRAEGGIRCGIVARLRKGEGQQAEITLGAERVTTPLSLLLLPGVGTVASAVVDFPHGAMDDPMVVTVAGIPMRETVGKELVVSS